ncbi:MAG: hypothetical protein KatS3mg008_0285 [Acidimicrobiales bacterium]|nr:MAG: hypothetical protein KatS3mg008_0285 [Acidimicrobiales bacterium]
MEARVGENARSGHATGKARHEGQVVVERSSTVGRRYCYHCRKFTDHRLQRVRTSETRSSQLRITCGECGTWRRLDGIDLRDPAVRGSDLLTEGRGGWPTRVKLGVALLIVLLVLLLAAL